MSRRSEFEKHYAGLLWFHADKNGDYEHLDTARAWIAWNTAIDSCTDRGELKRLEDKVKELQAHSAGAARADNRHRDELTKARETLARLVPIQYAVVEVATLKVVQNHPFTVSGKHKCDWLVKTLEQGQEAGKYAVKPLFMEVDK